MVCQIPWFFVVFETLLHPKILIAMTNFLYIFTKYHDSEYFVSKHMLVDWCKKYHDISFLYHDIQISWYSNTMVLKYFAAKQALCVEDFHRKQAKLSDTI
jgi:hypothetical protein